MASDNIMCKLGQLSNIPNGWRMALGGAGVPAVVLFLGSLLIPETPSSLIERGKNDKGRKILEKLRHTKNVDEEFSQIVEACESTHQVEKPFKKLVSRESRAPLVIGIMLQVFQQMSGINAIMFYAPILFQTVGFKNDASLLSSVVTGLVNVISTMVSIVAVDRLGRRKLLLQASIQMFISQVLIGALLQVKLKAANTLGHNEAIFIVVLVCSFVMCFAWSWGPLGWLIPSETFPIETRTTGFAFAVMTNMFFTFIVAQAFLSMLCKMKAAIFFLFGGWILIMGLFVVFLVPETKNIAIDEMTERVWKQHWFWKNCMDNTPTPQQSRQPINNARIGV